MHMYTYAYYYMYIAQATVNYAVIVYTITM